MSDFGGQEAIETEARGQRRQPVLAARKIDKSFGPVQVLHGISLDLLPGEVHALVGENGAGKSTLMKILCGYLQPDRGQLLLQGEAVGLISGSDGERRGIVLMHQELNLAEDLTVEESVFLGRELNRGWLLDKGRMRAHVAELLATLKCNVAPNARIRSLSVSQKQMVEIAKATDRSARVLIMDEPTSALTQAETAILFDLIRQLKNQGAAIVFVSHKLGEVKAIADCVTVLRDGHLVATRTAADVSEEAIAQLMVGRPLHDLYPVKRPPAADAEVVMQVLGLVVPDYVFGASFTLRRGEILGFGGLVGAGRTELMEAVVGLRRRASGSVSIGGRVLTPDSPRAAAKAGIAYLTEDRKRKGLLLRLAPRPNLTLSTLQRFMRGPFIDAGAEDAALDRAVDRFELRLAGRETPITTLSGGNQQKLLFAKVLEAGPTIVIVDEPTRGVDIGTKQHIYRFIADLAAQGKSVIVVSSEMPELIGISHRVVVMRYGHVAGILDNRDITESEIVRYATGLKGAA
jgi:ribose transport system ATP-binding protein